MLRTAELVSSGVNLLHDLPEDVSRSAYALEVALESMPVGVSWAKVEDQSLVFTNRAFQEMFGYTAHDFKDIDDWIERAYPESEHRALARQKWGEYFQRPNQHEFTVEPIEICVRSKVGTLKTVIVSGVILPDTGWALATFVDISERKESESRLLAAQRRALENQEIYRTLVDHSPEMLVVSPFDGARRYVSPAVRRLTGFSAEEYLSLQDLDFIHPGDREQARAIIEQLKRGIVSHTFRYRAVQRGGDIRWVEATIAGYHESGSDRIGGYVATVRDYTDQKRREAQLVAEYKHLSQAALKDELTGVANRRGFNDVLRRESLRQSRSKHDLSLLLLDVDRFKQYNDLYGHPAGDECLKRLSRCIQDVMQRESDLVARYGGEEFVVLMPMTDSVGAQLLASRILQDVTKLTIPHQRSPHRVVTVSIGVATWPAGKRYDPQALVSDADVALYRAKESGRNTVCCAVDLPFHQTRSEVVDGGPRRRRKFDGHLPA